MTDQDKPRVLSPSQTFSVAAAALVILIGACVLVGWMLDIAPLKQVFPGLATMKINSAMLFVFAGVSLLLLATKPSQTWTLAIVRVSAIVTALLGLLTACEYLFSVDLGIDELLLGSNVVREAGRMSLATALSFLLLGLALLVLDARRGLVVAQCIAVVTAVLGSIAVVGYAYDFKVLYALAPYTSMAIHTALAFVFLSVGILMARSDQGVVAVALRHYAIVGFAIALMILSVVSAGTYHVTRQFMEANEWVAHTLQIDQAITEVYSSVQNLQSGGRGYVITGDEKFFESLAPAKAMAGDQLRKLKGLVADNAEQQKKLAELEILVARRIARTEELIAARRERGRDAATEMVASGAGASIMAEIQSVITAMRATQTGLLEQRKAEVRRAAGFTTAALGIGFTVGAVIFLMVFQLLHRENRDRRQAELVSRAAEEKLRAIVRTAHSALIMIDEAGRIVEWNPSAEKIFGWKSEEIIGQRMAERIIPPQFRLAHKKGLQKFLETGEGPLLNKLVEVTALRRDGTEFAVELTIAPIRWGASYIFSAMLQDISERKRADAALRLSEERFRLMVSGVKDYAIFMLDPEGHVISWSEGAERINGYRAEEIIGKHFSRFYPQEDIVRGKPAYELKVAADRGRVEDEGWRVRKDGSRFWANVVITALRDERGELRGFGKVTRDMTERKRAEGELKKRSTQLEMANKELEAFSYSVSHDLRAPLRSIDGFSQALLDDYSNKLDEQGQDYLRRVRAATQRMAQLIDDMLSLSRVSRSEMRRETVDLSAMAREIASELQRTLPKRQVEFVIASDVTASGDPQLLRVALVNLMSNAWKFTGNREQARIEFGVDNKPTGPVFFVRDNGAGFDMAYANKLFGVFQRLHSEREFPGTGIGLATVQRVVRRHGGKVWAEGAVGTGATFYFTLGA